MSTSPSSGSWIEGAAGSGYDADHLPYGVFAVAGEGPRVGVRIGDQVLDLTPVAASDMLDTHHLFDEPSLNELLAAGRQVWESTRAWITGLVTDETERDLVEPHLVPLDDVTMLMPFQVGDYVDFYASLDHATNVGRLFRPDAEPLLPNWRWLPVGYHGRGGTVVPSGTEIVRPQGQRKAPTEESPTYGPSRRLDIEAELGFVVGSGSALGEPVPTSAFADHVFGVVGLNDWSARDVQAWEYVPLGPFLGKSFATSVSVWVTPLEALSAAWTDLPGQDPAPLDYLAVDGAGRALHRRGGGAGGRGRVAAAVRLDVLVTRADARPSHGERGEHPPRRPFRLRHDQRAGARPARLVPRAELGRPGAVHGRRRRADVPRGRRHRRAPLLGPGDRRRPDLARRGGRDDPARAGLIGAHRPTTRSLRTP